MQQSYTSQVGSNLEVLLCSELLSKMLVIVSSILIIVNNCILSFYWILKYLFGPMFLLTPMDLSTISFYTIRYFHHQCVLLIILFGFALINAFTCSDRCINDFLSSLISSSTICILLSSRFDIT